MTKLYLLVFIFPFNIVPLHAQTVTYPGSGDSLNPVTNFYNNLNISATTQPPTPVAPSIFNMVKSQGKYYLYGDFANLTDNSGSSLVLDTATNTIINDHKWRINGVVNTAIPDGQGGFYIGGNFTKIGDSSRKYIAQITSSGKPTTWKPIADNIVNALIKRNDTLFIGGAFKNFAGKARSCFAMYSTTGDSLCTNGGIQAFTFMQTIKGLVLHNDTLIYGGISLNAGDKNIRKYNFKNHVNLGWSLTYADYGEVNFLQLSPDASVLIYAAYSNGEYIKGANNKTGAQQYFINVSMYWPSGSNTGSVRGLTVLGAKAYAAGSFEHVLNNFGTFTRKGFFAFDPLTGAVKSENLNLDGYPSFLQSKQDKLFLSGKFTIINNVSRDQFAVIDTGSLSIGNFQISPSDPLTAIAFTGQYSFLAGQFKGIHSFRRVGFTAVDSVTHAVLPWNPASSNLLGGGKRMTVKGDSLFILGYNSNSGCVLSADTRFKIFSLSTGAEYSVNEAPPQNMNDFIIDGNYLYVSYDRKLKRYSLPSLVNDVNWGTNWAGNSLTDHSLIHLLADANNIYSVGDTRYTECASQTFSKRGYIDVYNKTTGQVINSYPFEGANNQYDNINFSHALLSGDRLFVQGYFNQLNGNVRRNFACINTTTGALTPWQTNFPNIDITQSLFYSTSDLKLYNGKIWFGSSSQILSDGTQFKGFGGIDTLTGNITSQPLNLSTNALAYSGTAGGIVNDFILNNNELVIGGIFDTVNTRPFRNFVSYSLTGINNTELCVGSNSTITSNINGSSYQWQMNSGSGFSNISDNANFSGTNNSALQLINVPGNWYGYQLRCLVNGIANELFLLKFTNNWVGGTGSAWENPANWSCSHVPDANTDVAINTGTVVINSSTIIRSLYIGPGVNITVGPGIVLTVLH